MSFKLKRMQGEKVSHKRMYKSKKNWVVAGAAFVSFVGVGIANTDKAKADASASPIVAEAAGSVDASMSATQVVVAQPSSSASLTSSTASSTSAASATSESAPSSTTASSATSVASSSAAAASSAGSSAATTSSSAQSSVASSNDYVTTYVSYFDDTTQHELAYTQYPEKIGATFSDFETAAMIKSYEARGYELVENDVPIGAVVTTDGTKYVVHLKHSTTTYRDGDIIPDSLQDLETLETQLNFEDNITGIDGTKSSNTTAEIYFTRTATVDNVALLANNGKLTTNDVTYSGWVQRGGTNSSATFSLPDDSIPGYSIISTTMYDPEIVPSQTDANAFVVTPTSSTTDVMLITRDLSYVSNQRLVKINIYDSVTNALLSTAVLTGQSGDTTTFDYSSYLGQGYTYTGANVPSAIVFNDNYIEDQTYDLYLGHQLQQVTATNPGDGQTTEMSKTVTRTINYVDADGNTLAPSVVQAIAYTRNGTEDLVTKQVTYDTTWTLASDSNVFDAVESPSVSGYTASKTEDPAYTVSDTLDNIVDTVTYTKDVPVTPTLTTNINIVDDVTGQIVKTITISGVSVSDFTFDSSTYTNLGYSIIGTDLPSNSTDNTNTSTNQTYTVHLGHQTTQLTATNPGDGDATEMSKTITRTINYVDANGQTITPSVVQTLSFMRYGTEDLVTKAVTYDNTWVLVSGSNTFAAVNSTTVTGYHTDTTTTNAITGVTANTADITDTVVYTKDTPAPSSSTSSEPASSATTPASSADSASSAAVPETSATPTSSTPASTPVAVTVQTSQTTPVVAATNFKSQATSATTVSTTANNSSAAESSTKEQASAPAKSATTSSQSGSNQPAARKATTHKIEVVNTNGLVTTNGGQHGTPGGGAGPNPEVSLGTYFSSLAGSVIFSTI